ncbi:Glycosyltransferase, GT2 family [Pseudoxanthomonas sp. CF385]|uniref:glycosyltransferase n=1 Tax=Pseudoxanthomonas sp. CF385 TaxID=1881042 RepID=UPI000883BF01|nr:glycosyltransferase [Pseudoxanthomonas sp. CF385]SDQ41703.1 Glycosyltransferase, GT2 family [Pseudoxanthomonas sp. CF385]
MSMSWADLRFMLERTRGLVRRGLASLRTRGLSATWARVRRQFAPRPPLAPGVLYRPADAAFAPFAVPASESPRVSIVIPVYNQAMHTLGCLRALAEHPPSVACEIIVVDDGSRDETRDWMASVAGLRYHRRTTNGGFIAACNDGAALARGDYLVFLNNDTFPQPGWLEALLDTFGAWPEAGLVGAQLVYPDGRLQEAGGVVFDDGSAWNYGRFDSPDDPRYASVRDADYCSGAAIMLPTSLFREVGGFDTRYAPAYYEDTDLAFAVRAHGRRVIYQPASRVVHLEGITAGTDTGSGAKAYQVRNRDVFARKWAAALGRQPAAGTLPSPAVLARGRRQVLVVDAETPRPQHDSASLRMSNLMRLLVDEGAHVVFLPADLRHAGRDTTDLRQRGIETWHAPFTGTVASWLREHGPRFDVVMLSRHYVASEFLPLVRRFAPQARVVFDTVDLHFLRETRGAEVAGDEALRRSAERTRERELALMRQADATLVVSPAEADMLVPLLPDARIDVLSNLHEVADGGAPYAQRRDLVFVGGFRHPPNVDAVLWFGRDVFPRIRERLPDVRFHCIGAEPPADVLALQQLPGIAVHGHVPDLAPYMDGARVAVAPLRFGAGVKGKVNLSMAHGQPVVATSCAVEGMRLVDGHDVWVADTADAFADAVVSLYNDAVLWERLSANGRENIRRHFSLDAARDVVRRVFLR